MAAAPGPVMADPRQTFNSVLWSGLGVFLLCAVVIALFLLVASW